MNLLRACMVLLALMVPGAYGIDLSYEQSDGSGSSQGSYSFGDGTRSVDLTLKLDPGNSQSSNHITVYGPYSASKMVYGTYGGWAQAGFSVTGSYAMTNYEFTSSTNPDAYVAESLSSTLADRIYAYGWSANSQHDLAEVQIDVYVPPTFKADSDLHYSYLTNYFATAKANNNYAEARQSADAAHPGDYSGYIYIETNADDYYDRSHVDSTLNYGILRKYPSNSEFFANRAYASRNNDITSTSQSFDGFGITPGSWWGGLGIYSHAYADLWGYGIKQDTDYFSSGSHVINQYSWTRTTTWGAYNSHIV